MATYLLTVSAIERDNLGLRVVPGFRMHEAEERPGIKKMIQGCQLELRRPDGTTRETRLVTYGVPVVRGEDGSLSYDGDIADPEVRITLAPDLAAEDVPPGTEVWLLSP